MKSYLLTIFSFIITAGLFSQQTHFPDSNAVWSVWQTKYKVEGDSTYNGKTYQKYFSAQDSAIDANTDWSYVGMVREDTNAQKVYAIHPDSTQENLLYDFSLSVGDTASVTPLVLYQTKVEVVVDSIDTVMINGTTHRKIYISDGVTLSFGLEFWIEGIGSTCGPLLPGYSISRPFHWPYPQLLCFERNGVKLYEKQSYEDCYAKDPYVSIDEVRDDLSVKVFPNPANDHISLDNKTNRRVQLSIIDMSGKKLYNENMENGLNEIQIDFLSPGVYILEMSSSNKVIEQQKLIVK